MVPNTMQSLLNVFLRLRHVHECTIFVSPWTQAHAYTTPLVRSAGTHIYIWSMTAWCQREMAPCSHWPCAPALLPCLWVHCSPGSPRTQAHTYKHVHIHAHAHIHPRASTTWYWFCRLHCYYRQIFANGSDKQCETVSRRDFRDKRLAHAVCERCAPADKWIWLWHFYNRRLWMRCVWIADANGKRKEPIFQTKNWCRYYQWHISLIELKSGNNEILKSFFHHRHPVSH